MIDLSMPMAYAENYKAVAFSEHPLLCAGHLGLALLAGQDLDTGGACAPSGCSLTANAGPGLQ